MNLTILTPTDWRLFKQIRIDALTINPKSYGTTTDQYDQRPDLYWREYLEDPGNVIIVAKVEDRPVGMIRLNMNDDEIPAKYAYLGSLFVYPEYRGKGIAKSLIQTAEKYVQENSSKNGIHLEVYEFLADAIALYEKLGYKIVEKRVEEGEVDVVMIKEF